MTTWVQPLKLTWWTEKISQFSCDCHVYTSPHAYTYIYIQTKWMIVIVLLRDQSKITITWEAQWEGMVLISSHVLFCELIEAEPWLLSEKLYSENRTSNWLEFTKAGGGRVQKESKRSATKAPQGQQRGKETGRNQCPEGRQSGSCAKVSGQVTK